MQARTLFFSALIVGATAACGHIDYGSDDAGSNADVTSPATAVVGRKAPDFELTDLDGKSHRLGDYTAAGKVIVLEWFNPDCPITRTYHDPDRATFSSEISMASCFEQLGAIDDLEQQDIVWLAINSANTSHKSYGVERNRKARGDFGVPYPILMDESGTVGQMYAALTTPHMFVIAADGVLIYDGAIDDGDTAGPGGTNYVMEAVRAHIAGRQVANSKTEPFGCTVKYDS